MVINKGVRLFWMEVGVFSRIIRLKMRAEHFFADIKESHQTIDSSDANCYSGQGELVSMLTSLEISETQCLNIFKIMSTLFLHCMLQCFIFFFAMF